MLVGSKPPRAGSFVVLLVRGGLCGTGCLVCGIGRGLGCLEDTGRTRRTRKPAPTFSIALSTFGAPARQLRGSVEAMRREDGSSWSGK